MNAKQYWTGVGARVTGLALLLAGGVCGRAVLFYSTGDPAYNSTAPSGSLAGSGWQYEGNWNGFLGTVIAPSYFITASHIGGAVGQPFLLNGVSYTTTAFFDDPVTDLRIWRVCGTFPVQAPLYTASNETGKGVVEIGVGTQRGDPVITSGFLGAAKTNGWHWGTADGVRRWGENTVADAFNADVLTGSSGLGELLQMNFDANGGVNECDLSDGDSGGGLFINDGGTWKLAGINYSVSGPYNTSSTGDGFYAAIFDEGGLYQQSGSMWVQTPDFPGSQPGSFYATRISSRVAWINSVISTQPASTDAPVLQSAANVSGTYADETGAVVNQSANTITIPAPGAPRFYRLRSGCAPLRITQTRLEGSSLVLFYQ
ncbi:MAG TPA: hypothetical protein VHH73_07260 [Verrucomicrobiae bacterium]|nr:hypothetical protein [Verrucomicrobiae bacterium]